MSRSLRATSFLSFLGMSLSSILLTPEQCKSHDALQSTASASGTLDALEKTLLENGQFSRAVRGELNLRGGPQVSASTNGGGTNPYGDYFTYTFPSDLLPPDACDLQVAPQVNMSPRDKTKICHRDWFQNWTAEITQSYLLGPADAIVLHLCTPPPTRYFGLDAYIGTRYEGDSNGYPFSPGTNYGDAVNQCTLRLPASAADPFDEPAFIIQTADGDAARRIAAALTGEEDGGIGADPDRISTHGLNASLLRLYDRSSSAAWASSRPDTLFSILRASVYLDEEDGVAGSASRRYYQNASWPVTFYFAADGGTAVEPLSPVPAPRAVAGLSETQLADALEALAGAVLSRFLPGEEEQVAEFPNATLVQNMSLDYETSGVYDDWNRILALHNNNTYQVGTRDAVYGEPPSFDMDPMDDEAADDAAAGPMWSATGDDNAVVAFGVLHTSSDGLAAAYQEVGVDLMDLSGATFTYTSWLRDTDLVGSALRYLQGTPFESLADQLFAVEFLPPGRCESSSKWCFEFNSTTTFGDYVVLAERVYSAGGPSCVGPDVASMLPTRGFIFDLRGETREPCEDQFGTFACAPALAARGAYELVYGVGCDSACDVQGCSQTIPVRSNPDLAPFGTCYTDFDPNTGAPTDSWQLACDTESGAFTFTSWPTADCSGACSTRSVKGITKNMCFSMAPDAGDDDGDDENYPTCNTTSPFVVLPCSGSGKSRPTHPPPLPPFLKKELQNLIGNP